MSVLFCDSNCELWHTHADKLGLKLIKMPFTLDGKEYYYDLGKETDFDWFYGQVRAKIMPTTSALNSEDYKAYFEEYFKAEEEILYISFSSQMSATFNYMDAAVKELSAQYPKARFIRFDTNKISVAAGLQVYLAAKYWNKGEKSIDEVHDYLKVITTKIRCYFMVDDLGHLKRGGRLSTAAAVFGTLLGVKPILGMSDDGKLFVKVKEKGRRRGLTYLLDRLFEGISEDKSYPICLLHADCEEDLTELEKKVKDRLPGRTVWTQPIGPVIGTHCGPGTVGVAFLTD